MIHPHPPPTSSKFRRKAAKRFQARQLRRTKASDESGLIDEYITLAEDERTALAKADTTAPQRLAADRAHSSRGITTRPSLLQQGKNMGYAIRAQAKRAVQTLLQSRPHVRFDTRVQVRTYGHDSPALVVTYDSGADGHYISEADRQRSRLPILRKSHKHVGVANGGTSQGTHVTSLPIAQLSEQAAEADTFSDFPHSLMSVGKTADDGTISIFTKHGVTVHKEDDVLITCKGEPILIGARDEAGRYRIPLIQQRGQWQPRKPSKQARRILRQANSVYDLPSTEQAIKWMHAVCGYPVKSTWLAAVQAGNYTSWPLLTAYNGKKYYPETTTTAKGHMNQT